jgi:hypothetical protein
VNPEDKAKADTVEAKQAATPEADVEKLLAIPHVREAVDKLANETEAARQSYSQAVVVANQFARGELRGEFPRDRGLAR